MRYRPSENEPQMLLMLHVRIVYIHGKLLHCPTQKQILFFKIALVKCYSFTEMKDLKTELSDGSLEVLRAAQRSHHR